LFISRIRRSNRINCQVRAFFVLQKGIPNAESPAGTGTGKPRRVARPRALAMAAERTKSRGEEAKTRAVAESTSITTTIAHRSRAPSYASPRRTEHNNGVTIARRHATANARDRHHHHRSCDRDRDHARDRSEHCAPNCHCGESIFIAAEKLSLSSELQSSSSSFPNGADGATWPGVSSTRTARARYLLRSSLGGGRVLGVPADSSQMRERSRSPSYTAYPRSLSNAARYGAVIQ